MEPINPFIAQTAADYDMSYEQVYKIYVLYPFSLYEKLEAVIKARSQQ